jgi:hypothetical protein
VELHRPPPPPPAIPPLAFITAKLLCWWGTVPKAAVVLPEPKRNWVECCGGLVLAWLWWPERGNKRINLNWMNLILFIFSHNSEWRISFYQMGLLS